MIRLTLESGKLSLVDTKDLLTSTHHSTLAFWNFSQNGKNRLIANRDEVSTLLEKVLKYLDDQGFVVKLDPALENILSEIQAATKELEIASKIGTAIKSGIIPEGTSQEFLNFARNSISRKLLPHQEKAALHMLNLPHSANFSVPGAGKSAVVLSVFAWLRQAGNIHSMFVVGPRSCFAPWQDEYKLTLGHTPNVQIIAGGDAKVRRLNYYPQAFEIADLYLTTYQTLSRDLEYVVSLFRHPANNVFLVVDEAHYIKQEEGTWANATLRISKAAKKRCVLTGTPFPRSYSDAINIFEALYSGTPVFNPLNRDRIRTACANKEHNSAQNILQPIIDPLYYRVRKTDLGLSEPVFLPPIPVTMKPLERKFYDTIVKQIRDLTKTEIEKDFSTIQQLKRGRIIRMRQVFSYSALLRTAIEDYDEDLLGNDEVLARKIARYDQLETPGKVDVLLREIDHLRNQGEKVVIWSNFIGTLNRIHNECETQGWYAKVICGTTPTQEDADEETREQIVEEFKASYSGLDILIANPAACAESISLHKTCSNAIYYDLSYNCAEYLQSIDRIHRVGGSETKKSYYRYLQYEDTVEPAILNNLLGKAQRMSRVIDREFPLCYADLEDVETAVYEQLIG